MSDLAKNRLIEEVRACAAVAFIDCHLIVVLQRKSLQKDKPAGMYAKPMKNKDGSANLFKWELGIKPKDGMCCCHLCWRTTIPF